MANNKLDSDTVSDSLPSLITEAILMFKFITVCVGYEGVYLPQWRKAIETAMKEDAHGEWGTLDEEMENIKEL